MTTFRPTSMMEAVGIAARIWADHHYQERSMEEQNAGSAAVLDDSAIGALAERMVDRLSIAAQQAQWNEEVAYRDHSPEPDPDAVEKLATLCHEANCLYSEIFIDEDKPAWAHAPEAQRESIRDGVRKHLQGGFLDPSESHNNWMSRKLREHWRYGETIDYEAKTHPCLLPWNELPLEQRLKDNLFGSIVQALRPLAFPTVTNAKDLEAMRYRSSMQGALVPNRF